MRLVVLQQVTEVIETHLIFKLPVVEIEGIKEGTDSAWESEA